jgi:uncharacterized alkaline shock family protein YloU
MADTADPVGKTTEARSYEEHRSENERSSPPANVHIAPEVLLTIARLTASRISGVSRLCSVPGGVNRLFKKNFFQEDGLCIEITDEAVFIDIYVALNHDVVVRDVCREIQYEVQRAITEMVGLQVGRVNIHVEDIDYPEETKG